MVRETTCVRGRCFRLETKTTRGTEEVFCTSKNVYLDFVVLRLGITSDRERVTLLCLVSV